jgi:hypothetical protein
MKNDFFLIEDGFSVNKSSCGPERTVVFEIVVAYSVLAKYEFFGIDVIRICSEFF